MKNILSKTLFLLLSTAPLVGHATGIYNYLNISEILLTESSLVRVTAINGTMVTDTTCSTTGDTTTVQFAFDPTTALGKARISLLMTAQATGKQVHLLGSNVCLTWAGAQYEEITAIYLLN